MFFHARWPSTIRCSFRPRSALLRRRTTSRLGTRILVRDQDSNSAPKERVTGFFAECLLSTSTSLPGYGIASSSSAANFDSCNSAKSAFLPPKHEQQLQVSTPPVVSFFTHLFVLSFPLSASPHQAFMCQFVTHLCLLPLKTIQPSL